MTRSKKSFLRTIKNLLAVFTLVGMASISFSQAALSSAASHGAIPFRPHMTCVAAPGGINCINIRTWASNANPATSPTVILLDGLRATWIKSGWEYNTNVQFLADHGINVVEPVGGDDSFYTDWNEPSKTNNQLYTYKWETFLTQYMPPYLDSLGFSRNYSLVGLSMSGGAALTLTAHHPELFKRAASISGFLHLTAPGFSELLRIAFMSQNNYDLNAMWGDPGSARWYQNDPYQLVPALRNTPLWISAGSGFPGSESNGVPAQAVFAGMALEVAAKQSAEDFRQRAITNGLTKVHYSFPTDGVHDWEYWQEQVWSMQRSNWFNRY